jgi:arsenate reductase
MERVADTVKTGGFGMDAPVYNVLFICTGNSARSIMAEAILEREGKGHFRAWSAGSKPKGEVDPRALVLLRDLGHDLSRLRSKSWDEFAGPDAPAMDFIFTVCDDAAGEVCPVWPGHPNTAHWGVTDPARTTGTPAEVQLAFDEAYRLLKNRILAFVSLPLAKLDTISLVHHLTRIGGMGKDNATESSAA